MKRTLFIVCCSALIAFQFSCGKTGPEGPAGPAGANGAAGANGQTGPSFKGAIAGYVGLYDQYGKSTTLGLNKISVTLDSAGKTLASMYTTPVASSGYFLFPNVYTGVYEVIVHDSSAVPAYGDRVNVVTFVSDTAVITSALSAIPNYYPSQLVATTNKSMASDSLYIYMPSTDAQPRYSAVFIGNTNSVSSTNYLSEGTVTIANNALVGRASFPASLFYDLGISSGQTAYFAVYGEPYVDHSAYLNPLNGLTVYTALNPQYLVDSVLVP